jgi:RNA-directed DNA polymerase
VKTTIFLLLIAGDDMSGRSLYQRLCDDPRILNQSWVEVKRNAKKLSKGMDDETLLKFSENSQTRLRSIRLALKKKSFKFSKLRASSVLKRDGSPRPIQVAAIQDRIVLKAVETLIRKQLDERYNIFNNPVSYAYIRTEDIKEYDPLDPQTYKGVRGAVEKLKGYIADGYTWCVKADIIDFFPTIERNDVLKNYVFPALSPDKSLNTLIKAAFKVDVDISSDVRKIFGSKADERFATGTGLPQGSVLSPLFANVYLYDFDKQMSDSGFIVIRYVDDFIILCKSEQQAKTAHKMAKAELSKLGLKIHNLGNGESKTEIKETGDITFLGIRVQDNKFYPSREAFEKYTEKVAKAPKYRTLAKNLQYLQSLSQSWGSTYNFCSNNPVEYAALNQCLYRAVERTLYKSRLKAVFSVNSRQLKRLGLRKFDDSVAYSHQRQKDKMRVLRQARA